MVDLWSHEARPVGDVADVEDLGVGALAILADIEHADP
jgi:hypothetical protein